ncbi:MAG: hypothetical protein ACE15C_20865 [Phycisphaerae bacterium]
MGNSDREIEYADEHLPDGRAIAELAPGQAYVCNPHWGVVKVHVRPPLSKVWEPTDDEVEALVGKVSASVVPTLSASAQAVVDVARDIYAQAGRPVRLADITERLGITSRRRVDQIVEEIQRASAAQFRRLPERGRPLVVVPIPAQAARTPRTETRTETGAHGEA